MDHCRGSGEVAMQLLTLEMELSLWYYFPTFAVHPVGGSLKIHVT